MQMILNVLNLRPARGQEKNLLENAEARLKRPIVKNFIFSLVAKFQFSKIDSEIGFLTNFRSILFYNAPSLKIVYTETK